MSHLKFCSCRACRRGRHSNYGKSLIRRANRKLRYDAKRAIRTEREPMRSVSVSYTD
jgi:hypothetical protein